MSQNNHNQNLDVQNVPDNNSVHTYSDEDNLSENDVIEIGAGAAPQQHDIDYSDPTEVAAQP